MKQNVEKILGRNLKTEEGISQLEIQEVEKKLAITIPGSLKELYLTVGNIKLFMDGFQHFAKLSELLILDNKLVFLEENQGVLYWAVDLNDLKTVYQTQSINSKDDIEWDKEEFELSTFLKMILYYQCLMSDYSYHKKIEGSYEFHASLDFEEYKENKNAKKFISEVKNKWEKIISGNGISIFCNESSILSYFINDRKDINGMILIVTKDNNFLDKVKNDYGFEQL